jgi:hypothetical protein
MQRATQYCPARMNQPHEPNTVMKDNDLTYKLRLGPSASRRLHEVLMADVRAVSACVRVPTAPLTGLMCKRLCAQQSTFLCRHAVMDYSLLLGVHRNKYNLVDKRVSEAEFASLMGGSAPWLSRSSSQIPPSPTRGACACVPLPPRYLGAFPCVCVGQMCPSRHHKRRTHPPTLALSCNAATRPLQS